MRTKVFDHLESVIILFVFTFLIFIFYFILAPKVNTFILKSKELKKLNKIHEKVNLQKKHLNEINWVIDKIPDQNPLHTFVRDIESFAKDNDLIISGINTKEEPFDDYVTKVFMRIKIKGMQSSFSTFFEFIDEYPIITDVLAFQLNFPTKYSWELAIEVTLFYLKT